MDNKWVQIADAAIKAMDEIVGAEQILVELMRTYSKDEDTWEMLHETFKRLNKTFMMLDSIYDTTDQ